ncbi:MAG: MarR family transcriptional regulator [Anaerolineae bacterium]
MTAFNPRDRDHPAAKITIGLYRIAQAIGLMLRRSGMSAGLSPAQVEAILFLRYSRPGVHTIGGLAERLRCTYPTASGIADALERKGLIHRSPLPADRRVVTLELTDAGRALCDQLEGTLDGLEEAIASLPRAEQDAISQATTHLVRHLQQAGYVLVYEMCWGCQFFLPNAHPDDPGGPHHCAFVDAPLQEEQTYLECPDAIPRAEMDEEV